jgi:LmbE family N-acetylglucosaminyl deacetylase
VLRFPPGTISPSKKEVVAAFRNRLREVHPDHGASHAAASAAIGDLAEARRLLTEK